MEKLTAVISTVKLLISDCTKIQERLCELKEYESMYLLQAVKNIVHINLNVMKNELNDTYQSLRVPTNTYEASAIRRTKNIDKLAIKTEVGVHKMEVKIFRRLDKIIANHATFVDSLTAFLNAAQKLLTEIETENHAANIKQKEKKIKKFERKINCWRKKARATNTNTTKKHYNFLKLADNEIGKFSQKHKKRCRKVVKRFRTNLVRNNIVSDMIR